jgi:benzoyl-CoA 2,3-epoxidase subunit B
VTNYLELELPKYYHNALLGWQKRQIPDLPLLMRYWEKYFPNEQPYRLKVKLAPLNDKYIKVGMFKGQPILNCAGDMKGNMLYSAVRIIKAQCSTELGSIQQHNVTLDKCTSDTSRFSMLRIMADELRHSYQMFWVLSHDSTWSTGGINRLAANTMEELLAMHTGTHVLDAFNIPFHDALDNIVFTFLVDRVGKYQLNMQKAFAYAPMARSMVPMLEEESFHLFAGYSLLKEMAVLAAVGQGYWDLAEIQRRINAWYPRAIEMFGNPESGMTNIVFGFKDRLNGESAGSYITEVIRLIRRINTAIVAAQRPDLDPQQVDRLVEEQSMPGLLRLPHTSFFRMRGPETLAYKTYGINGEYVPGDEYFNYLKQVLPSSLIQTEFFERYRSTLMADDASLTN